MKQTVLVTGGAGYVGSHTCKALALAGFLPVALDNLACGHSWAVKWGPLEVADIRDESLICGVFERHRPSAVVHCAGSADVRDSVFQPTQYYSNNVLGTLSILAVMRQFDVDKLVFSSSCAVYGVPNSIPVSEEHPKNPISPYGRAKLMAERILEDFDSAHRVRSISLRYFNAAGADPEGEIGEDHASETHLIPRAILALMGIRPELEIFGTDFATEDGTARRDFVHVSDLAAAHVAAIRHLSAGGRSNAINLGTGRNFSVREVVRAVDTVSGYTVPVRESARKPGDPPNLMADTSTALQILDWKPQISDICGIVRIISMVDSCLSAHTHYMAWRHSGMIHFQVTASWQNATMLQKFRFGETCTEA